MVIKKKTAKKTSKKKTYKNKDTVVAPKVTVHETGGDVVITHPDNTIEEKHINVKEPEGYAGPVCNVGFKMGMTKNLGNYESVRIDVSLYLPCYTSEIETVFEYAREWVDDRMDEVITDINKDIE